MPQVNLYDLLDIKNTATSEEIKAGFRNKAKIHHPDHNKGQDDGSYAKIKAAYDILSNPEKRKRYDFTGYTGIEEAELHNNVFSFIRSKLDDYLNKGENIFQMDIIKNITTYSKGTILVHKGNILGLLKKKDFIIRVNKKFHRKRPSISTNIIYKIMLEKVASIDQQINGLYIQIEVLEAVVRIINEYEFDFIQFLEQKPEETL